MTKLTIGQVEHFPSVQRWLFGERKYKSVNRYLGWMTTFCHALNLNPDQIISNIEATKNPIEEMKKQHAELTAYYRGEGQVPKSGKPYIVGTVDKRMCCLHSFYRANGIQLPPMGKTVRDLRLVVWSAFGLPIP